MKNFKNLFKVYFYTPFICIKNCELIKFSSIGITIKYKKPRSSKYVIELIPINTILSIEGNIGEIGTVYFLNEDNRVEYNSTGCKGRIVPHKKLLKFIPEDKTVSTYYFNPKYAKILNELEKSENVIVDDDNWEDD